MQRIRVERDQLADAFAAQQGAAERRAAGDDPDVRQLPADLGAAEAFGRRRRPGAASSSGIGQRGAVTVAGPGPVVMGASNHRRGHQPPTGADIESDIKW